jgi:hypothetical protein
MLTAEQLSEQIEKCVSGDVSLDDFESWFSAHSRNAHIWADKDLQRFVFDVESVFSRYYFEDLPEHCVHSALAEEAQSFARPFVWSGDSPRAMTARERLPHTLAPVFATAAVVLVLFGPPEPRTHSARVDMRVSSEHASEANATAVIEMKHLAEVVI